MTDRQPQTPGRVDWVDYAKGICIIAVVILYCVGGVEGAMGQTGWMHEVVYFAEPFRMPAFFLVSGLFLARTLDRPWRSYLDTKVIHFLYFYVLWLTIEFVVVNGRSLPGLEPMAALTAYLRLYVQPEGHLWFIYMLPLFFLAPKLLRGIHPGWIVAAAVVLKLAAPETGWKMIDRFAMYFVFFACGFAFAPKLFRLADACRRHSARTLCGLAVWGAFNLIVVKTGSIDVAIVHLVMGCVGALAVLAVSALLAGAPGMGWLRLVGQRSIVLYLAFFFPMLVARKVILDYQLLSDPGNVALAITVLSIIGSFLMYWMVRRTPLRALFERPQWATLQQPYTVKLKKAF